MSCGNVQLPFYEMIYVLIEISSLYHNFNILFNIGFNVLASSKSDYIFIKEQTMKMIIKTMLDCITCLSEKHA